MNCSAKCRSGCIIQLASTTPVCPFLFHKFSHLIIRLLFQPPWVGPHVGDGCGCAVAFTPGVPGTWVPGLLLQSSTPLESACFAQWESQAWPSGAHQPHSLCSKTTEAGSTTQLFSSSSSFSSRNKQTINQSNKKGYKGLPKQIKTIGRPVLATLPPPASPLPMPWPGHCSVYFWLSQAKAVLRGFTTKLYRWTWKNACIYTIACFINVDLAV